MSFDEKVMERKAKKRAEREKLAAEREQRRKETLDMISSMRAKRPYKRQPAVNDMGVTLNQFQDASVALNKESVRRQADRHQRIARHTVVNRNGLEIPVTGEMAMRKAERDNGMVPAPGNAAVVGKELER